MPSTKGKGSVMQRISFVQEQKVSVTKHSVNVIKEYRNYLWERDDNNKSLNIPEHAFSHSMDAVGYGLSIRQTMAFHTNDAFKKANEQLANLPPTPKLGMFNTADEKSNKHQPNNWPAFPK